MDSYRLEDFHLVRRLGEGATGEVFAVRPLASIRSRFPEPLYALKRYRPSFLSRDSVVPRLKREWRLLQSVRHPNIIRYEHFELRSECPFSICEYFAGQDLSRWGRLTDPCPMLRQVLAGLSFLHSQGILHRDVKPENTLYDGQVAKLCDFGVAKGPDADSLTNTGEFLGTIRYAPPEYLFDGSYTAASDLFGFGHIAYFAYAGGPLVSADQGFARQVLQVRRARYSGLPYSDESPNGLIMSALVGGGNCFIARNRNKTCVREETTACDRPTNSGARMVRVRPPTCNHCPPRRAVAQLLCRAW